MRKSIAQRIRQLRRNILSLCAMTLLALWGMILYALHFEWESFVADQRMGLLRHASVTSGLIHESLIDASKILDAARLALQKAKESDSPDRLRSYEIIHSVVESFSIYNTSDTLGLLLYLDKNGILVAQNGAYPAQAYDLNGRTYFRHLRDDPGKKFMVGRIREAMTTGKWVFHLAMPIHDVHGAFAGVVAYQIRAHEIAATLDRMFGGVKTSALVQTADGGTAFLYPLTPRIPESDIPLHQALLKAAKESHVESGTMRISGAGTCLGQSLYVGFVWDPLFELVTTTRITESTLIDIFLARSECLIALSILSSLTVSALFYGLYRKAYALEHTMRDSSFDYMTKIWNRRSLEREFQRLWRDASRRKKTISVLFIDIDRFKEFNDSYGHEAGDRVLRATARVIERSMSRPLDLCCRWGGEEFLAVLPETSAEEARAVAERIRERIRIMKLRLKCTSLPQITLSIGIAASRTDAIGSPDELIARADKALLLAKEQGRDQVFIG